MGEHPAVHDDPERTQQSGPPDMGPAERPAAPTPVGSGGAPRAASPAGAASADQTQFDGGPFATKTTASSSNRPPVDQVDVTAGRKFSLEFDAPTVDPPTIRVEPPTRPADPEPPTRWTEIKEIAKEFLHKHERKIWWLHTVYALSLGAFVATFSQKGFEQARFLTLSLGFVWLLVVAFFRFFGTGAQQDFITAWPGARRRFFIMTYLMKNLFQGMLFFLLPLYYRSGSSDAKTIGVMYLLSGCAVVSTLDLVFDRVLLRFKLIASLFFSVTLFGVMNVAIPALHPDMKTLVTLLVSGGLAVATFFLFHIPLASLKRPLVLGTFVSCVFLGVITFYVGRRAFPAVPMYVKAGGVGPAITADGTLSFELKSLRVESFSDLFAVTDVAVVGHGDALVHVWRHDNVEIGHVEVANVARPKEKNLVRVTSHVPESQRPASLSGHWTVDVETESGQIVGRVAFDVRP